MPKPYEATGKIHLINDTQTFASGFTKREFVLETNDDKYPQLLKFEVVKDGCAKLDRYNIGDIATVSFNVRGNEYNGKYYVSLQAWRIDGQNKDGPPARSANQNGATPPSVADGPNDHDDIPF